MKTLNRNFKMVRGDTLAFSIVLSGLDTEPDRLTFSTKAKKSDETYIFQKTLDNGIESDGEGKYKIRIAPEDTESLTISKLYYDLELRINGDAFTILMGTIDLVTDITRPEVGNG